MVGSFLNSQGSCSQKWFIHRSTHERDDLHARAQAGPVAVVGPFLRLTLRLSERVFDVNLPEFDGDMPRLSIANNLAVDLDNGHHKA